MYAIYNYELKEDFKSTNIKTETKNVFGTLFDNIKCLNFESIHPLSIPYKNSSKHFVQEWYDHLSVWLEQQESSGHISNLNFSGFRVVKIQFHYSRFERKRFLTFVIEQKFNLCDPKAFILENSKYPKEFTEKFLHNKKLLQENEYIELKYYSGSEYYTVANPFIILSEKEAIDVNFKGFYKYDFPDFELLYSDDYLKRPDSSRDESFDQIYIKLHIKYIIAKEETAIKKLNDFITMSQIEYLSIIRTASYQKNTMAILLKLNIYNVNAGI